MAKPLRITLWNANGLWKHAHEIPHFLKLYDIDILFISDTHFTDRSYIKVPTYVIYDTPHPDETAHGGTAIIIRQNIKHHIREAYKQEHIQATSVVLKDNVGELNIAAVYSPPNRIIKESDYTRFFHTLGHRFIAGGGLFQC
jgi:exonuclease III